jgi:hypothetical protein
MGSPPQEINLISCGPMAHISDIKLIRTDTTLDLSQKAEKGMNCTKLDFSFYNLSNHCSSLAYSMWDMKILENLKWNMDRDNFVHLGIKRNILVPHWLAALS